MGSPPPSDDALKGPSDGNVKPAAGSAGEGSSAAEGGQATQLLEDPDLASTREVPPVADPHGLMESTLGLAEGNQVGNYRLQRPLGQGSFAEVWLAVEEREHGFAKRVALKLMKAGAKATADELDAMRAEARLCAMLHHPRLVDVYAAGDVGDITFIAMEYVEGMTLFELQQRLAARGQRLPISVVVDIAIQICEGLDYAHNAKDHDGNPLHLVHRDLKPGNIMVSRGGEVKVADFGLAKTSTSKQSTKEGLLRGTPGFVAPEVWRGTRDFRPRVDLFALGAMVYELATGTPLFTGDIHSVIFRVVSGDVEEDMQHLRLHRPVLAPVLRGLLERDPEQRMQHAWEPLEALRAVRRKIDDAGGLKLFLSLFLPDDSSAEESGRLHVLPSTVDPDWQAVLGSVSLLSSTALQPLDSAPPEVPTTRSMKTSTRGASRSELGAVSRSGSSGRPSRRGARRAARLARRLRFGAGLVLVFGLIALWALRPPDSAQSGPELASDDRVQLSPSPGFEAEPPAREVPPQPVEEKPQVVKVAKPMVKAAKPVKKPAKPAVKTVPVVVKETPVVATETPPAPPIVEESRAAEPVKVTSAPPVARKGCLVLKSNPGGFLVSLNGKDKGWLVGRRGREEEVEPGSYAVGMGGSPGEVDASVKVRVRGGERLKVECSFLGAAPSCKSSKLAGTCGD